MRKTVTLAFLLAACGTENDLPDQGLVDDARVRVTAVVDAAGDSRAALELLGILPDYTCDQRRDDYVSAVMHRVSSTIACASVTSEASAAASDTVTVTFPAEGCRVLGHDVAGAVVFLLSWGDGLVELVVDFGDLVVDGSALDAAAGYRKCGDETAYWVTASGVVSGAPSHSYAVDGRAGLRDGLPVIGGTTLLLDGSAEITGPGGVDSASFRSLEYELGDLLPRGGLIVVQSASGHRVEARFHKDSSLYREVELTIDDHDPVTVPLL